MLPITMLEGTVEGGGGMEALQTVVTFLFTNVTNVVTMITAEPLLLIPIGLLLAGGAIGLGKRLFGR